MRRHFDSAQDSPKGVPAFPACQMPHDWMTVTTQSTARMQIPMNIQLVKLKLQERSALIAAKGRFSIRPKWETTKSVPTIAAAVAMRWILRERSHRFIVRLMPASPTNQRKNAIVQPQWLVAA